MTNTTNKNLQRPANNTFNNTWDQPLNTDFSYIDSAFGGFVEYSASVGSQTLTSGISDSFSYIPLFIKVKNSMGANVTYTIPAGVGGTWIVYNTTTDDVGTGPWTVTFASGGGGASAVATRNTIITIVCDGTNVYTSSSAVSNVYNRTNFTATAAQTTFTVSYTPSRLDVYVNGVLLAPTDYTASNGATVILGVACSAGDLVSIMTY